MGFQFQAQSYGPSGPKIVSATNGHTTIMDQTWVVGCHLLLNRWLEVHPYVAFITCIIFGCLRVWIYILSHTGPSTSTMLCLMVLVEIKVLRARNFYVLIDRLWLIVFHCLLEKDDWCLVSSVKKKDLTVDTRQQRNTGPAKPAQSLKRGGSRSAAQRNTKHPTLVRGLVGPEQIFFFGSNLQRKAAVGLSKPLEPLYRVTYCEGKMQVLLLLGLNKSFTATVLRVPKAISMLAAVQHLLLFCLYDSVLVNDS